MIQGTWASNLKGMKQRANSNSDNSEEKQKQDLPFQISECIIKW